MENQPPERARTYMMDEPMPDNPNAEIPGAGSPRSENSEDSTWQTLLPRLAALLWIIVIAILVAFGFFASSLCITVLLAAFLAILIDPLITSLERWHVPRTLSSALVIILGMVAVGVFSYTYYGKAAAAVDDIPQYAWRIRQAVEPLSREIEKVREGAGSLTSDDGPSSKKVAEVRIKQSSDWPGFIVRGFGSLWGAVIVGGIVPFLTFFMLIGKDRMSVRFTGMLGSKMDVPRFVDRLNRMVRGFVVGNLIIGAVMMAVSVAVFWSLGMNSALEIGMISGFLNLIPFLGVLLAAIVPLMAATFQFSSAAPFIIIVLTVFLLHMISANILIPKFIGSRVQIGPVAATIGMLFWGWLWGVMGLLLAVPLTSLVKIIADSNPSLLHLSNLLAETPRPLPHWARYGSHTLDRAVPFLRERFSPRARS
jgi:predicted PurR-regulated permease PerM